MRQRRKNSNCIGIDHTLDGQLFSMDQSKVIKVKSAKKQKRKKMFHFSHELLTSDSKFKIK